MSTNSSPPQYFWFPVLINGSLRYVPVAFSQFQGATMNGTEPENVNNTEILYRNENKQQQVGFAVENLGAPPVNPFELVLILLGLVANFVTLTSILCAGLINHNANKYIFILLMADTLYLLCSLADALQTRTLNFFICASTSWMSSCCVYVSSLCVVMLSIERALAIFCPLEHLQLVYVNRWLLVTFCALPFLLWELTLTYVTIIDTSTDVYDSPDVLKCATEAKVPFEGLGALVSNCFQFLLPLTCVFFLNATIVFKIRYSSDMNFLKGSSSSDSSSRSQPPIELSTTVSSSDNSSGFWEGSQQQQQQPNRKSIGGKATAAASSASSATLAPVPLSLFLVPLVYVLLNSPFYTIRFLKNSLNNDTASLVPWEVERTAYFLFLANFATNSIVYAFASPSFRRKIANWARKPVSSFQSTTGISGRRGG